MIERDGYPFVIGAMLIALACFYGYWSLGAQWAVYVGALFFALGLFCAFFFRSPERSANMEPGMIVSPSDGRVLYVRTLDSYPGFSGPVKVIAIFLSVFDVHVNWIPISGTVTNVEYISGEFKLAYVDKASEANERSEIMIESASGPVLFKQIAGTIARRIVYRVKKGDTVKACEKFGLIKFGSRMEVFFDAAGDALVEPGQHLNGGESIIAQLPVPAAGSDGTAAVTENTERA